MAVKGFEPITSGSRIKYYFLFESHHIVASYLQEKSIMCKVNYLCLLVLSFVDWMHNGIGILLSLVFVYGLKNI